MLKKVQKLVFYFMVGVAYTIGFNSCAKDAPQDLCANIICNNGGSCANGLCNCASGWTGSDCSRQATPLKIRITKIDILKFPPTTTNGAGWDVLDGPDITVTVTKDNKTIWDSPTFSEDATQNKTYTFTPSTAIEITAPKDKYAIELYDYDDLDDDDFMGGINFIPYFDTNNFPTSLTLECTGCTTSFKIYLQYVF